MEIGSLQSSRLSAPAVVVISSDKMLSDQIYRPLAGLSARLTHHHIGDPLALSGLSGAPDLLVVALSAECGTLDFLEPFMAQALAVHCPVIVSAPLTIIDQMPASAWHGCQAFLSDPDEVDLASAAAFALSARPGILNDVSRDLDAERLQRLADEVGRIARTLATMSASAQLPNGAVADMRHQFFAEMESLGDMPTAHDVRAMIRLRRLRDRFFDSSLFADPAWDMLLDLMAARLERVQVAVSSLCIAAHVPPTTALRWIKLMTDNGLFERVADPGDGRRIFIRLSDAAAAQMARLLQSVRHSSAALV
ncbi:MAG: hypothetical protein RL425_259 [Pseudomonadota bacterium]